MMNEAGAAMAAITPLSPRMASNMVAPMLKLLGVQGTGGSTSASDSFDKLREANVDYVQGYTVGEPVPIDSLIPEAMKKQQFG